MDNRSVESTRRVLRIVGGIIYAVGTGLIIFSFATFFLAPIFSIVFTSVFIYIILGFIATFIGRSLVSMSKTKDFTGPISEQRKVNRREVQEDMTYDYTFVSDREAKIEKRKSASYSRCPECDSENEDKARTCVKCGASLTGYKKCALCYKLNKQDARFCTNCGHDFNLD